MRQRYFVRIGIFLAAVCLLLTAACSKQDENADPVETPIDDKQIVENPVAGGIADSGVEPEPVYYTLTYVSAAGGTLVGQASQQVAAGEAGSPVTAVAADGHHFMAWSDGVASAERIDENVIDNQTITATFALNEYALNYRVDGNGTIEGESSQTVEHGSGGTTVTAVPAANHHFVAWSDGIKTAERTERNLSSDVAVTARFAVDQYCMTYTAGDFGNISGKLSQCVAQGSAGSAVTAVPDSGYHFVGWSDGHSEAQRIDRNVTADLAVTANFAINRYKVTYSAGEQGTLEGEGVQTVTHGADAEPVQAIAGPGYHFVAWSDGVATAQRSDQQVTADLNVSARFALNTYAVGGTVSGLAEGTRLLLRDKAAGDVEISVDGIFQFATQLPGATLYEVMVPTQPRSPNHTCIISDGSGVIAEEDVTGIRVECTLDTYTIGGTVAGLPDGDEIVLQNKGSDSLSINADGPFVFPVPIEDGSSYEVEVHKPLDRLNWICDVHNPAGLLVGEDVDDVEVACYPQVLLQVDAGIGRVRLDWNAQDFTGTSFDLCLAREEFERTDFDGCIELQGGALHAAVVNPLVVEGLSNNQKYHFLLRVRYDDQRMTYSDAETAIPFGGLNDTGIDWCADSAVNRLGSGNRGEKIASCEELASSHSKQDAMSGRDYESLSRTLKKIGTGTAGFDFTRLCRSGEAAGEGKCPPNPIQGKGFDKWACNRDNVTGLIWELKEESGLRAAVNTYSWYQPDETVNGGAPGRKNAGTCQGSACDTFNYVRAVNQEGLCGASDWRLPTRRELLSIVDNGRLKPALDPRQFPHALSEYYWTASPYADNQQAAWQVYFLYGEASPEDKSEARSVRLVSGKTVTFGMDNP